MNKRIAISQIQEEYKEIEKSINKKHEIAERRTWKALKELRQKFRSDGDDFYFSLDGYGHLRDYKAAKVRCPYCKATGQMEYLTNDVTQGFRETGSCRQCKGRKEIYLVYGYRPETKDDSYYQIW